MVMTLFDVQVALDPSQPNQIAAGAEITIYAHDDDAEATPLVPYDQSGVPLAGGVVRTNAIGLAVFQADVEVPSVRWRSGVYAGLWSSGIALAQAVTAAQQSAADSADAAAALSDELDANVAAHIQTVGSATRDAVIAVAGTAGGGGTPSNIVFIGPGDPVPDGTPDGAAVLTTLEVVP